MNQQQCSQLQNWLINCLSNQKQQSLNAGELNASCNNGNIEIAGNNQQRAKFDVQLKCQDLQDWLQFNKQNGKYNQNSAQQLITQIDKLSAQGGNYQCQKDQNNQFKFHRAGK